MSGNAHAAIRHTQLQGAETVEFVVCVCNITAPPVVAVWQVMYVLALQTMPHLHFWHVWGTDNAFQMNRLSLQQIWHVISC